MIGVRDNGILVFPFNSFDQLPQLVKVFLCPIYSKETAVKAVKSCASLHA